MEDLSLQLNTKIQSSHSLFENLLDVTFDKQSLNTHLYDIIQSSVKIGGQPVQRRVDPPSTPVLKRLVEDVQAISDFKTPKIDEIKQPISRDSEESQSAKKGEDWDGVQTRNQSKQHSAKKQVGGNPEDSDMEMDASPTFYTYEN